MSNQSVNINENFPPVVVFDGGTDFDISPSVSPTFAFNFDGNSDLQVFPDIGVPVTFDGDSDISIIALVNGEITINVPVTFDGDSALQVLPVLKVSGLMLFDGNSDLEITPNVLLAEEASFTVFVDILDSAFAPVGNYRNYNGRLTIDSVEVPIQSFVYNAPRNSLGSQLSVVLQKPLTTQFTRTSDIKFEIGTKATPASSYVWQTILENGALDGSQYTISFNANRPVGVPNDTLTFNSVNPTSDRLKRAPRVPKIYFDSQRVTVENQFDLQNALRDEDGNAIIPTVQDFANLSLYDLFNVAYVNGCGFSSVQTNIPNYFVARADFTIENGWHGGIAPLIGMYEPIYFTVGNVLWIIDKSNALPSGVTPRDITVSDYRTITTQIPSTEPIDALIVSHSSDFADFDFVTTRIEQETNESGTFGLGNYTRTETTRTINEYRNTSNPVQILREVTTGVETTTLDAALQIIGRETQQDFFDGSGRKTGHNRTVEALVPRLDFDGTLGLLTILDEVCNISYKPNPVDNRQSVQDLVITKQRGLIHIDNDNTYLGSAFKSPFLDAHRSGAIDAEANQASEFGAIKTVSERFEQLGNGQVQVKVKTVDHIRNTVTNGISAPRVGDGSLARSQNEKRRTILFFDDDATEIQSTQEFSTGELPTSQALALARRKLNRLNNPPQSSTLELVGIDFLIRKGSVIRAKDRAAQNLGNYIVEGFRITGNGLGTPAHIVTMSLECEEII